MVLSILTIEAIKEGRLNLNNRVKKYLQLPNEHPYTQVKVVDLLNMRSGVHIDNKLDTPLNYAAGFTGPPGENSLYPKDQISFIQSIKNKKGINQHFFYSDSDSVMLQIVLEEAFQKSYQELFRAYILDRVSTKNSIYIMKDNANRSIGYAGVLISARDLARFMIWFQKYFEQNQDFYALDKLDRIANHKGNHIFYKNMHLFFKNQIWYAPLHLSSYLIGMHGQLVKINYKTGRLAILLSNFDKKKTQRQYKYALELIDRLTGK